jgi:hypothetical protein
MPPLPSQRLPKTDSDPWLIYQSPEFYYSSNTHTYFKSLICSPRKTSTLKFYNPKTFKSLSKAQRLYRNPLPTTNRQPKSCVCSTQLWSSAGSATSLEDGALHNCPTRASLISCPIHQHLLGLAHKQWEEVKSRSPEVGIIVVQAGLEHKILLLPQPPRCWDIKALVFVVVVLVFFAPDS